MSSFPGDTREQPQLVGEGGAHSAGVRDWASMADCPIRTLQADTVHSRAFKLSMA
jgi:hypothetical protein